MLINDDEGKLPLFLAKNNRLPTPPPSYLSLIQLFRSSSLRFQHHISIVFIFPLRWDFWIYLQYIPSSVNEALYLQRGFTSHKLNLILVELALFLVQGSTLFLDPFQGFFKSRVMLFGCLFMHYDVIMYVSHAFEAF